jgi:hypothetical protein
MLFARAADEYPLPLRRADQARRQTPFEAGSKSHPADFASNSVAVRSGNEVAVAIADDLDFIKGRLARIPTRMEVVRLVLLGALATAGLVFLGEALLR